MKVITSLCQKCHVMYIMRPGHQSRYVYNMPQFTDICFSMLMTCYVYSDKTFDNIETKLNDNFNSLFDWFVDNKAQYTFWQR